MGFAIAVIAFPVVVVMGRRAGALRVIAEKRYAAIMGKEQDTARPSQKSRD